MSPSYQVHGSTFSKRGGQVRHHWLRDIILALLILLPLSAHSQTAENISVTAAYIPASIPGVPNGVAYMQLQNNGADDELLDIKIASSIAQRAEIHTHSMVDGLMSMRKLPVVEIAKNSTVVFKPHGLHVMLLGLQQPLELGMQIDLVLEFASGAQKQITFPVRKSTN